MLGGCPVFGRCPMFGGCPNSEVSHGRVSEDVQRILNVKKNIFVLKINSHT